MREIESFPVEPGLESPLAAAAVVAERSMLATVNAAIRRRDVMLAFQPVVRSGAIGQVAFHEGLVRILDEAGHVVPAGRFIAEAETTETGRLLDCLALEMGLRELALAPELRLSINMSARSIGYPLWTETLRRGLDHDVTAAERLILEITESSAMMMPDITSHFVRSLRRQGISFALDNFGAGHTSFRHLRDFTFDAVKIDGQFVRGIEADADNQCLTRALIAIAGHFDMFTVAEAVETADEALFMAELGVDCQQGYFHGFPSVTPPWRTAEHGRRTG